MHDLFNMFAASCTPKSANFFSFPSWDAYLPHIAYNGNCSPQLTNINDVWLIVAAVIDILLHIVALLAVGMVIYGGVSYTASQGDPQRVAKAKSTILYAIAGLVLSIGAASILTYIATSILNK